MAVAGLSDRVRSLVGERYVRPALKAGKSRLAIGVKDVLNDSAMEDFPRFRTPVICQALLGNKLLSEYGLEIESVEGPPSKQSRTVVVHYRFVSRVVNEEPQITESPAEKAFRLTERLRGLMKDEIAAHGGTEAYMRWVRSDEEDIT